MIKDLLPLAVWFICLAAVVQHWVTTWANDQLFLFLVGLVLFPVGIVHGLLIWLGVAG